MSAHSTTNFAAMLWAADVACPRNARLLLMMMARHSDHRGHCPLSRFSLGKALGVTAHTVMKQCWALEEAGLIDRFVIAHQGGHEPHTFFLRVEDVPAPTFNHLIDQDNKLRLAVLERDGHRCTNCGATEQLVLDHKIPAPKGPTTYENLHVLCGRCNHAKGGLTMEQWRSGEFNNRGRRR